MTEERDSEIEEVPAASIWDLVSLVSHPMFHSVVLVLDSYEQEQRLQDLLHPGKLVAHTIQVGDDPATHQHFRAVVVHKYQAGCQWCHVGHVWHHEAP